LFATTKVAAICSSTSAFCLDCFEINFFLAIILLGKIVRGQFHPTLSLLERIEPHTTEKIYLDEKQAWLFTCKRDIFVGKDIKDTTSQNIILVLDSDNVVIGLAKKQTVKGEKLYTPIYDIGDFMRREK
jgi:ribosome biogenesis protein Nip4